MLLEQTKLWGQEKGYNTNPVKALEITDPNMWTLYTPITNWRIQQAVSGHRNLDGAALSVGLTTAYVKLMKKMLRKDTAVLLPFYYCNESFGDNPRAKHENTMRDVVSCLKNLD